MNRLGIIHKGRLLKGVGRWVHQKEIYYIRLYSKKKETRVGRWGQKTEIRGDVLYGWAPRELDFLN